MSPKALLPFIFFFLTTILLHQPAFVFGQEQSTLIKTDNANFQVECSVWTVDGSVGSLKTTQCAGMFLLGGYNILPQNAQMARTTWNLLPAHGAIQWRMKVVAIDGWSAADTIKVTFDTTNFYFSGASVTTFPSNLCGGGANDIQFWLSGTLVHVLSSMTMSVTSQLTAGPSVKSFGIRDFYFLPVGFSGQTNQMCVWSPYDTGSFSRCCPIGQYLGGYTCGSCYTGCSQCWNNAQTSCVSCYPSYYLDAGECKSCNPSCSECTGPLNTNCNKCPGGNFLYWSGKCLASCPSPLTSSTVGGVTYCNYACTAAQYLYWDGSCAASCPSPSISYTVEGKNLCTFPCTLGSDFAKWDGTCLASCPAPFVTRLGPGIAKFCDFPCPLGTHFYYWDGTCQTTCPSPLVQSFGPAGAQYCNFPCSGGTPFLKWDNTCIATCNSPFVTVTGSGGVQYCNFPCPLNTHYYYWDTTCQTTCASPLVTTNDVAGAKYCDFPCPLGTQFLKWDNTCVGSCNSPFVTVAGSAGAQYCNFPCPLNTHYYYWDTTCQTSCASPLVPSAGPAGAKYCDFPCPLGTQWLYWDNTCQASCPAPYSQSFGPAGAQYCDFPCTWTEYLYSNNSCLTSCSSPRSVRNQGLAQFCDNPCPPTQYLTLSDGLCHPTCSDLIIVDDGIDYCDSACPAGQYRYENGTCVTGCTSPHISKTQGGLNLCLKPCSGSSSFYQNNSCINSCDPPFIATTWAGINFCDSPCPLNSYYFAHNSSCTSTCNSPYVGYEAGLLDFCLSPCTSSQFFAPNGSCINSCDYPLHKRNIGGITFCDQPCPGQFYYRDGSCYDDCQPPYSIVSEPVNQCVSPCPDLKKPFFVEKENLCKANCEAPYEPGAMRDLKLCTKKFELTTSQIKSIEALNKTASNVQATVSVTSGLSFASGNRGIAALNLLVFDKFLFYLRYLDLDYPDNLKYYYKLDNDTFSLSLKFPMPDSVERRFSPKTLPQNFEGHDFNSSFLINYWDNIFTDILVIGLAVVVYGISLWLKRSAKYSRLSAYVVSLTGYLGIRLPFLLISSGFDEIVLFSFFDFATFRPKTFGDYVSFLFGVVFLGLAFASMGLVFHVVRDFRRHLAKISPNPAVAKSEKLALQKKWRDLDFVVEEYKEKNFWTQGYLFVFLLRTMIYFVTVSYLYSYPFAQIWIILLSNVGILAYIFKFRPFQEKLAMIEIVAYEINILFVNLCVLIIAFYDHADIDSKVSGPRLGNAVISGMLIFAILGLFFTLLSMVLGIISLYRRYKELRANGTFSLLNLLYPQADSEAPLENAKVSDEAKAINGQGDKESQIYEKDTSTNKFLQKSYDTERMIFSDGAHGSHDPEDLESPNKSLLLRKDPSKGSNQGSDDTAEEKETKKYSLIKRENSLGIDDLEQKAEPQDNGVLSSARNGNPLANNDQGWKVREFGSSTEIA